jgi:hypothetical protein
MLSAFPADSRDRCYSRDIEASALRCDLSEPSANYQRAISQFDGQHQNFKQPFISSFDSRAAE